MSYILDNFDMQRLIFQTKSMPQSHLTKKKFPCKNCLQNWKITLSTVNVNLLAISVSLSNLIGQKEKHFRKNNFGHGFLREQSAKKNRKPMSS